MWIFVPDDIKECPVCGYKKGDEIVKKTATKTSNNSSINKGYNQVLSVPKIFLFLFIMSIPVINLIMAFSWSFKRNINKNKKNLARVFLIIYLVTLGIYAYMLFF